MTLVGLLLRLVEIGSKPLWSDEALTLLISKWPVAMLMLRVVDPTPGLYYLLHKLLISDSASLAGIRAISLVCGVALIPLVALFGTIVGGRRVGLLSAGLVALSAPLIDYSQEARAYALLVLLIMASAVGLLLMLRAIATGDKPPVRQAFVFATCALLAFYTHFIALFWIGPAVFLLALTAARTPDASVQRTVRLTILAIFLLLPFLLWIVGALSKPVFMPRTMLWSVPGYLTAIAVLLDRLDRRWLMVMSGLAGGFSLAANGTMRVDRQDMRPFQREIARGLRSGDAMMVCRTWRAPELRHSVSVPLPLPLLTPMGEDMVIIERSFGSDPRWQDDFGWIVTRPAPEPVLRMIPTSGRLWLLASQCNERDRRRINRWLGPGRWVRLLDDQPDALLPVILWRFDPAQPARLRPALDFPQR